MLATYRRINHAAHSGNEALWDIEEWSFQGKRGKPHEGVPANVPSDAKYSVGYHDHGRQFWVYTRKAPASGAENCQTCKRRNTEAR